MASTGLGLRPASEWDYGMVALAMAHAAVLVAFPSAPVIAIGLWWNSNTISHNFIHRPFFAARWANLLFGAYLSALLGIPQSLWRDRHLAHHAGVRPRVRVSAELVMQVTLVLAVWAAMGIWAPAFFLSVYVPGYAVGLAICWLHGYYEHASGATSHYGKLYNHLFFNDGYHVEHHAYSGVHWTHLPGCRRGVERTSAWPAPLRWLELFGLESLEGLVLKSRLLQRFLLRTHARAFRALAGAMPQGGRIAIVGGGLFPRTALVLRELLPGARLTVIDAKRANLDKARTMLGDAEIEFVHKFYVAGESGGYDAVVIPLSLEGDRDAIYSRPPAPIVVVHDWIWRKRGMSAIVSLALFKRINLVRR